MNIKKFSRSAAGVMAAALAVAAVPSCITEEKALPVSNAADTGKVVFSYDFEDGDVSDFTNRGGDDTTEISASTDAAASGTTALLASGRSESWNGPAFRLDDKLEPFTEYYLSAKIKGRYYTEAMLSFQYTADGTTTYSNLVKDLRGEDWIEVKNVKISFTDEMEGVYVYFEGGSNDIFIDDFVITEVPTVEIEKDIPSLRDIFYNDFKVGTALTPSDLSSKPFMALAEKHFGGSVTVGNEMKPENVLNQAACKAYFEETGDDETPQISFAAAKPVLNYCRKNNIPVRIHTLVWHSQTPNWFFKEGYEDKGEWVSKEKMLKRMENYIKIYFETLTELYPDIDFYACDVVNEAWTDDGSPRKGGAWGENSNYELSAWVKVFGDNSFIEPAFTFAKKYAPEGCKLYYNDYNEYMTGKMDAICKMAEDFKAKGIIDGIGMQSHLDARQSLDAAFPSVSMYNAALDRYSKLGLDIQITELDATVQENSGDKYFDVQAEYYKGIIDAIYKHKDSVSAVIWWGITDDISWRASQNPLLFDAEYKAKPAYYSITKGREIPDIPVTEAPTKAPTTAPTTAPTEPVGKVVYGDANVDGEVSIADATAILQHIGNPDVYGLEGQGLANADCYDPGSGVTGLDALAVQKYDAKVLTVLPERID